MSKTVTIDPVTRIEGHAKITIHLDDSGQVENARFHVTQLRGFETICEGRPFSEMPSLMARVCGICPVSHLVASSKACDRLLAVQVPKTGADLRRIMNLAQLTQSHALSFFHLSSPDLLLGMDADPKVRNVFGVIAANPDMARMGIKLRQIGQQIIEILGGRRIHPAWCVPGGVSAPLTAEKRDDIMAMLPDAKDYALKTITWYKGVIEDYRDEIRTFGNFPSLFMGLVGEDGSLEHYDGVLRVTDASGNVVEPGYPTDKYADIIGEAMEPWSYLKSPYYIPQGYPDGMYRVGPLARLNIIDKCGTPLADEEWAEFRSLQRGAVLSSFHYHYARLVEIVYAIEKMWQLLSQPEILDERVRAIAEPNAHEGIGVSEAPRGTLIHHYRIDDNGLMEWANLIIATGNNNLAINRSITQVAKHYVKGDNIQEGMLNRVEAVVRAYDPCLSCSSHAAGQMPMQVTVCAPDGRVVKELRRD
jgi:NAD-reducing hydrogenase large subunit